MRPGLSTSLEPAGASENAPARVARDHRLLQWHPSVPENLSRNTLQISGALFLWRPYRPETLSGYCRALLAPTYRARHAGKRRPYIDHFAGALSDAFFNPVAAATSSHE